MDCELNVLNGFFDLVFIVKLKDKKRFKYYYLIKENFIVIVNKNNLLLYKKSIKFEDFKDEKFIIILDDIF